jgi:hypothetical protein
MCISHESQNVTLPCYDQVNVPFRTIYFAEIQQLPFPRTETRIRPSSCPQQLLLMSDSRVTLHECPRAGNVNFYWMAIYVT